MSFVVRTRMHMFKAPRIQFYAIEIARNREGFNEKIKETTKKIQESLKDVVVE